MINSKLVDSQALNNSVVVLWQPGELCVTQRQRRQATWPKVVWVQIIQNMLVEIEFF